MPVDNSDENHLYHKMSRRTIVKAGAIMGLGLSGFAGCIENASNTSEAFRRRNGTKTPDSKATPREEQTETTTEDTPMDERDTETPEPKSDSSNQKSEKEWFIQPDSSPDTIPTELNCENSGVERFDQQFSESNLIMGGSSDIPWELRVNTLALDYGEKIRLRLRYTGEKEAERGTDEKHNIQIQTDAGWQELRVKEGSGAEAWTNEAVIVKPGDTHIWEFQYTEDGIPRASHPDVRICPELQNGRYRFVFWGIDDPIGVSFDLTV